MELGTAIGIGTTTLVILYLLAWSQRRVDTARDAAILAERNEAERLGTERAIAQHPQIDRARCVGCSSCIAACPEEQVIVLAHGIAQIVHGSRCIGHGRCEAACPVGAIQVGLGDIRGRADLPVLSASGETSVPGVSIAGELGGIALVRNAVRQGVGAIDAIAAELSHTTPAMDDAIDVLIVGAGPAGFAATLRAHELGLSYRTIEQSDLGGTVSKYPRQKLTMTESFELPLYGVVKGPEVLKEQLLDIWTELTTSRGLAIETGVRWTGLERRTDGLLDVATSSGPRRARRVILALGRRGTPRRLGVDGEQLDKVVYQLMDATSYQHRAVCVVGGGDSALEAAIALARQPGTTVTLSYRKPTFTRVKPKNRERLATLVDASRINAVCESRVEHIARDTITLSLPGDTTEARTERMITNDFVFVLIGGEPPYPLLKQNGIHFGDDVA